MRIEANIGHQIHNLNLDSVVSSASGCRRDTSFATESHQSMLPGEPAGTDGAVSLLLALSAVAPRQVHQIVFTLCLENAKRC